MLLSLWFCFLSLAKLPPWTSRLGCSGPSLGTWGSGLRVGSGRADHSTTIKVIWEDLGGVLEITIQGALLKRLLGGGQGTGWRQGRKFRSGGCMEPSLVAQWLRIHLPMQGTWVQSLIWEDPTCHRAPKPMCYNYWAHEPQLLKPVNSGACALQQAKPLQWEARTLQLGSSPGSLQLEIGCAQLEDPEQPKKGLCCCKVEYTVVAFGENKQQKKSMWTWVRNEGERVCWVTGMGSQTPLTLASLRELWHLERQPFFLVLRNCSVDKIEVYSPGTKATFNFPLTWHKISI